MNRLPCVITFVGQIVNLCMTVVTGRDAVVCFCRQNLVGFEFTIGTTRIGISGLEKSTAAAATVIVRPVRVHVDEILFTHDRFYRISQIFSHRVAKSFPDELTGILYCKFNFQVLVPIGIDLQLSFPDPLGIILNDAPNFKFVFDIEFFQSGPDCKKFVPSLSIEPDFTF